MLFSLEICLRPSFAEFHLLFRSLFHHCLLVFVYCLYIYLLVYYIYPLCLFHHRLLVFVYCLYIYLLVYYIYPLCLSLQVVAVRQLEPEQKIELERKRQLQSVELGDGDAQILETGMREAENYSCRSKRNKTELLVQGSEWKTLLSSVSVCTRDIEVLGRI